MTLADRQSGYAAKDSDAVDNPINYVDPSGHAWVTIVIRAGKYILKAGKSIGKKILKSAKFLGKKGNSKSS